MCLSAHLHNQLYISNYILYNERTKNVAIGSLAPSAAAFYSIYSFCTECFLLHKTGKRMDACIQIHLPVVRTWSTKCGMFVCEIVGVSLLDLIRFILILHSKYIGGYQHVREFNQYHSSVIRKISYK